MQYTKNYHLPQWVKEDRIMMEDFNAMNSSIENGLTTANTNASTAKTDAAEAKQAAGIAYTPDNKPFATGTYTGDGGQKTFQLGFRPSCLIISGLASHGAANPGYVSNYFGVTCGGVLTDCVQFTDTGFTVLASSIGLLPSFTTKDMRYDYIAFK